MNRLKVADSATFSLHRKSSSKRHFSALLTLKTAPFEYEFRYAHFITYHTFISLRYFNINSVKRNSKELFSKYITVIVHIPALPFDGSIRIISLSNFSRFFNFLLAIFLPRDYIFMEIGVAMTAIPVVLFDNRYISANVIETHQVKESFASCLGEMYPVKLCFHILPGASLHAGSRFLVGPLSQCLGAFGSFTNVFKYCWISQ